MNPNGFDLAITAALLALLVQWIRAARRACTAERRLARAQVFAADLATAAADLRDQLDEHELAIAAARTEITKRRHLHAVAS